jgi:hypothetical protein
MLWVCAVVLPVLFLAGVGDLPSILGRGTDAKERSAKGFHRGGVSIDVPVDPTCQGKGCHDPVPHRKSGNLPPFLNMHLSNAECLSCHGRDAAQKWTPATRSGTTKRRIASSIAPDGAGKDRHGLLGKPLDCRGCHSAAGREALRMKGIADLPQGFAEPLPLRMIEQGAKSWIPADLR